MTVTVEPTQQDYSDAAAEAVDGARGVLSLLAGGGHGSVEGHREDIAAILVDQLVDAHAPTGTVRALEDAASELHAGEVAARAAYRRTAELVSANDAIQREPSVPAKVWLMGDPESGDAMLYAAVPSDSGTTLYGALLSEAAYGPPGQSAFSDAVSATARQEEKGWQLVGAPADALLRPFNVTPTTAEMCRAAAAAGIPGFGYWDEDA